MGGQFEGIFWLLTLLTLGARAVPVLFAKPQIPFHRLILSYAEWIASKNLWCGSDSCARQLSNELNLLWHFWHYQKKFHSQLSYLCCLFCKNIILNVLSITLLASCFLFLCRRSISECTKAERQNTGHFPLSDRKKLRCSIKNSAQFFPWKVVVLLVWHVYDNWLLRWASI